MKTFLDANGYFLAGGVFPSSKIADLEEEFDRIVGQFTGPAKI